LEGCNNINSWRGVTTKTLGEVNIQGYNNKMIKTHLEAEKYYHIYNHANGKDNLFVNEGNYDYFLGKYKAHISSIVNTFSYCLMPNHFHFAIQIKSDLEILKVYNQKAEIKKSMKINNWNEVDISHFISQQFSNFFTSYAQAFNKQQGRRGSLFSPNFERKEITSDKYLKQLIRYIHYNPIHHGFTSDIRKWRYSSYNTILSNRKSFIDQSKLIEIFNNLNEFREFHENWSANNQKSSLDL
jgi:REP element-mobilizing transposase RayT